MQRVRFNNCINKEVKLWNVPIGSLIGGGILGSIFWILKGLFGLFGGGAIGFVVGGWFMREWYLGNIQRYIYWNLPSWLIDSDRNKPSSAMRHFM